MIVSFSSKGGTVQKIVLKDFVDFKGDPLVLIDDQHAAQHIYVEHLSRSIDLSNLYYETKGSGQKLQSGDTATLVYTVSLPEGQSITYTYTIPGEGYENWNDGQTKWVGVLDRTESSICLESTDEPTGERLQRCA